MCGRYRLSTKERYLRDHFGLEEDPAWTPRYNIAPAQMVPIIRQEHKEPRRRFSLVRWGLIPYWAEDASIAFKTINAMSETAAEKPAFRDAMRWRRCLVPADGFYEWKRLGLKEKQAHNFGLVEEGIFAFAGLWETWRDRTANQTLETCTILTTSPNSLVASVHDRMPVILREYILNGGKRHKRGDCAPTGGTPLRATGLIARHESLFSSGSPGPGEWQTSH